MTEPQPQTGFDYTGRIELDFDALNRELRARSPRRVYLEIPRWLRFMTADILTVIRNYTGEIFLSGEDTWGACYFDVDQFKRLEADCLVHVGHAKFCSTELPVILVPYHYTGLDHILKLLADSLSLLSAHRRLHLELSLEFCRIGEQIEQFYNQHGFTVSRHKSGSQRVPALGCRYGHLQHHLREVDALVYVADQFYSDGAIEESPVPVFCIEPYLDKVLAHPRQYGDEYHSWRRQIFESIPDAERIAILVDVQFAQAQVSHARAFQRAFQELGHSTEIVLLRGITPEKIEHLDDFDLFVNTACPRLLYYGQYSHLDIVTAQEASAFLGSREYPSKCSSNWLTKLDLSGRRRANFPPNQRKGETTMPFGSYGPSETLIDVKSGFGKCPKCGDQSLQTKVYEKSDGGRVFKNECASCGHKATVS